MISKLSRIKGLGLVFSDFTWPAATPAFRAVNLVYGWNGCGKTTLTRLFDAVAAGVPGDLEYEIEDDAGAKVRHDEAFTVPIRVFNQDYIQSNVRILESNANTISVLLGEENQELVAAIAADEQDLNGDPTDPAKPGKIFEARAIEQQRRRKEKENETAFTDIAKAIGAAIIGSGAAARNYRSPNAKTDFERLSAPSTLSADALRSAVLSLRQELMPEIPLLHHVADGVPGMNATIDAARGCLTEARELLIATVEAQTIERLSQHPDIAEWVERGLQLHADHSDGACEYCGGTISENRVTQLARHFSDADRQLKGSLDAVLARLRVVYVDVERLGIPDSSRFYQELREPFEAMAAALETAKAELLAEITTLGRLLQDKKLKTTEVVAVEVALNVENFEAALLAVDGAIASHNKKCREFGAVQRRALAAIKTHYLSTIHSEVQARNADLTKLGSDLEARATDIATIQQRVAAARAAISSTHKACEQINNGLKTFLGREELKFEPQTAKEVDGEIIGYRITRRGEPATHLSEGEKTAIAFVYFVVHLADGQFSCPDGIVVIDDPISSLDSNSMYQAFSFLKNAVKDCHQVFILTHNFEFLKLLLNWRARMGNRTSHYMITNHFVGDDRRASISPMDKELREYESEYHYLFKRLKEMRAEQDGSIMKAYPVPNMARKVWESFLMFRVPNGKVPYAKMDVLKSEGADPQKLDAIYKFTNDQSHVTGSGFDPALVPEAKNVLALIFEQMEVLAPEHFKILDAATN